MFFQLQQYTWKVVVNVKEDIFASLESTKNETKKSSSQYMYLFFEQKIMYSIQISRVKSIVSRNGTIKQKDIIFNIVEDTVS